MTRWGMVIDQKRCIACFACMIACKQEHFLPAWVFWNRVLIGERGNYPSVTKENLPVLCNHCKDAACVNVCPTGATSRREDGIVIIDSDDCVGCRYCMMACPYQMRTFLEHQKEYYPGQGLTPWELLGREIYPLEEGTVVKCNLCLERIDEGLKKGLKPGVDREATPACVNACPTKARIMGDLDDRESEIARLIKERRGVQLHPEFGTDPSVYYLD